MHGHGVTADDQTHGKNMFYSINEKSHFNAAIHFKGTYTHTQMTLKMESKQGRNEKLQKNETLRCKKEKSQFSQRHVHDSLYV